MRQFGKKLVVRLLIRTTRRFGVTEIDQRFLTDASVGLAALTKAVSDLDELRDQPASVLRLNLSRTAADIVLLPHLPVFMATYPDITLELDSSNGFVDMVTGGFDAGIRLEEYLAQDVVSLALGGAMARAWAVVSKR